jgi:hypothetical protein
MKTNFVKGLIAGFSLLLFISPLTTNAQFNSGKSVHGPEPTTVISKFKNVKYTSHLNGAHTINWNYKDYRRVNSFSVMVSSNGLDYTAYKEISFPSSGSTLNPTYAIFIDEFMGSSRFIKLRANLIDGSEEFSSSREVLFYASKKTEISTWPNPANEDVQIADIELNVTDLIIYDQYGSVKQTQQIVPDQDIQTLNVSAFETGFYHMIFMDSNGNIIQTKRIFKQ